MEHPEHPYVASGYMEDSATKWTLKYEKQIVSIREYLDDLSGIGTRIPTVHSWGVRYETSVLKKEGVRFREEVNCSEDNLFNMEYFRFIDSISVLDTVEYRYRMREDSAVKSFHVQRGYYEKCVCQALEKLTGDTGEFRSALYVHFIISLEHYWSFFKSERYGRAAKKQLHATLRDKYFRRSLDYAFCEGSLDMKIFAVCVKLYSYRLYKFALGVIKKLRH